MHKNIVKTTVGAILKDQDQILLALRNHDPFYNHWCIPGGHIDFSESVEHAMQREINEETGLTVTQFKFFNYYTEYFPEYNWHAVALIFVASIKGSLQKQEKEVKELKWYNLNEALKLPLAFVHKQILLDYKKKLTEK